MLKLSQQIQKHFIVQVKQQSCRQGVDVGHQVATLKKYFYLNNFELMLQK